MRIFRTPSGPGVRVDSGVVAGDVIGGSFDSMLAKLIVTGRDRAEALERSRRALAEFEVEGLPTVLPFHRRIVEHPAFAPAGDEPFSVYTSWIETEFENDIPAWGGEPGELGGPEPRRTVVVESDGKRIAVSMPKRLFSDMKDAKGPAPRRTRRALEGGAGSGAIVSPMQATVVKAEVSVGDRVVAGDLLVVLEAMKMEQPLSAPIAGTVAAIDAPVGKTVPSGHHLVTITPDA